MPIRTRNAALLAKLEAVEDTPETPSASTDAVLVENPRLNYANSPDQTNEVTGSLDPRAPIPTGAPMEATFDVLLKGSGTAETPPEFGDLLKACGFDEVITAAAVPAAPEACGAGGSTTTAQLGASASATAQAYRGMPLDLSGAQTLDSFITDYTAAKIATLTRTYGAAIVATSNYQVPKNVLYKPVSSGIPSATLNLFRDGLKWVLAGCRGDVTLRMTAGRVSRLSFRLRGRFVSKTDVAVPACTYQSTRPVPWMNGVFEIDRTAAALETFELGPGNNVVNPPNPNASEGFDAGQIVARAMGGRMDPLLQLVATRDLFADMRAGTSRILHAHVGSVAGNRVGITVPKAAITGANNDDKAGLSAENVTFFAEGEDAGAFICFW